MKQRINQCYQKAKNIFQYGFISILSTILDTFSVWILFHIVGVSLVIANTVGIIAGFLLGYILSVKRVFNSSHGAGAFMIYFLTFLGGLFLANYLISKSYQLFYEYFTTGMSFILSKGVSIVVPFFGMYFARKYLYQKLNKRSGISE